MEELLRLWFEAFQGRRFTCRELMTHKPRFVIEQTFKDQLRVFIAMHPAPPEVTHYDGNVSIGPEEDPTSASPATLERRFNLYLGRLYNGLALTSSSTGGPSVFQVVAIVTEPEPVPEPEYTGERPLRFDRPPVV